jgi:two-component system, NtrC family, response regulator AtoC
MRNEIILVVEDDTLIRWSLVKELEKLSFTVREAGDLATARAAVRERDFDIILLDQTLPDGDGLDLLHDVRASNEFTSCIMITAVEKPEFIVQAMREGVFDYFIKPVHPDKLFLSIERALESTRFKRRLFHGHSEQRDTLGIEKIISASGAMRRVLDVIAKFAQSSTTTVLVTGESGTGKELVAHAIHALSDRKDQALITVNCSAFTETLIESELFGHEKGAYTDAKTQRKGLFELADKGTIFLDEIADMSLSLQAKVLRVLEERAFRRVGGSTDIAVDVRVVAATNQDLADLVKTGNFREDLFYRLFVGVVHLPPLRDREDDAILLAEHFLRIFNRKFRRQFKGFSENAKAELRRYHWPGNVRELKNVVERAVLLAEGEFILSSELSVGHANGSRETSRHSIEFNPADSTLSLVEREKSMIVEALRLAGNNQSRAAKLLQISRDTLRYRLKKYHLAQ